jgi:DNA-binding NarL/FixJ family response regulator
MAIMSEQIRVLIVDGDALVRSARSMLLAGAVDIAIVGEATDGSEVDKRKRHAREQLERLTDRERDVAIAIGLGKPNEIGRELYMSVATVKAHVSHMLEKLELNNRVQIALIAHDAGEA